MAANSKKNVSRCRECNRSLGAGYICDECDTVEEWP